MAQRSQCFIVVIDSDEYIAEPVQDKDIERALIDYFCPPSHICNGFRVKAMGEYETFTFVSRDGKTYEIPCWK